MFPHIRPPQWRFLPQMVVALVLVCALAAIGVGVAVGFGGFARHASQTPTPVVLRWANENVSDLASLDPATGVDLNSRQAAQIIFGGLVRFGPGFHVLPDAASSWKVTDGGRTYTFYLRPDVRFGDGSLLTASDVAFSLNRTLSPDFANHSSAFLLQEIAGATQVSDGRTLSAEGIQVLGPRTLRIRLVAPTGSFLARLATPAGYIVSPAAINQDPQRWAQHAFGTGPFKVARWVRNTALFLVPNPYYWGGKPRVTSIDMPFIPEPLAAYKLYRAGGVDTMGTIRFPTEALYDVQGRTDFHRAARLETEFLTLNERIAPFNSLLVRQAFARAVNKAALVRDVFANFAHPTNGMMPPGIPGYNPALKGMAYDPQRARQLLARAGYPGGRGLPTVTYAVDVGAQNLELASALAAQWQRVLGVQVQLQQAATHSAYDHLLDQHAYQIAVIDWTADYPDPENFVTQQLHTGSPNNNGAWSNAAFDRLTDRAASMPEESPARLALYRRAEELAMDQAATIPLVNPTTGILLRSNVHGLEISGGQLLASDWTRVTVSQG